MLKSFWDHSGKPSVFVVIEDGKEIYRGPFKEGYELYSKKISLMFKNCQINQATLEVQNKT
jgi:hypothetical protein